MRADIAAIELTLYPRKFNRVPEWLGRAAQAQFYSTLHRIHPMVAETIHDLHRWQPIMPKPFTLSNLMGAQQEDDLLRLHPARAVTLRLTLLHPHLTRIGLQGVLPLWQREGICLHDQPLWVRHTHKVLATYADLRGAASEADTLTLTFTAPTAFKRTKGHYLSRPEPAYIFRSLYNRWNGFAEERLPPALDDSIQRRLRLVESDVMVKTLRFARGSKGIVPGFHGRVQIALDESSAELRQMLHALAAFAPFSGVGIKTTVGMGQVKLNLAESALPSGE